MFRKFEKTLRIIVPQVQLQGKHYLSKSEVQKLLSGQVTILEKLDGANTAIIRHKNIFKLQKRGSLIETSEHVQFQRLKDWSAINYEKIMNIPKDTILYGEWMYAKHTVFYDKLPDYFIPFAWYDKKLNKYLNYKELKKRCDEIGLIVAPLLYQGAIDKMSLFDLIPNISNFGSEKAEGLVVWNYKQQMRGKVVRAEFQKAMDEDGHWMHKQITRNRLETK